MAFDLSESITILTFLRSSNIVAKIATYIFSVVVYMSSIPIACIVIQLNLKQGNICGKSKIFRNDYVYDFVLLPNESPSFFLKKNIMPCIT